MVKTLTPKSEVGVVAKKAWGKLLATCGDNIRDISGAVEGDIPSSVQSSFADGCYIREWFGAKDTLVVTKIHKKAHPFFILKGEVSVATEEGVVLLRAPYAGITPAGTQRLLYVHEDTNWVTVHVTNETDVEKIEKEIIAETIDECIEEQVETGGVR